MDKKLKRTIGYRPDNISVTPKKDRHPLAAPPEVKINPEVIVSSIGTTVNISEVISVELGKVEKIVKWINEHPEFKWGVMCNKIGIDKGNFQRTLKSDTPKIKIEFIPKIETFLINYGYAK